MLLAAVTVTEPIAEQPLAGLVAVTLYTPAEATVICEILLAPLLQFILKPVGVEFTALKVTVFT